MIAWRTPERPADDCFVLANCASDGPSKAAIQCSVNSLMALVLLPFHSLPGRVVIVTFVRCLPASFIIEKKKVQKSPHVTLSKKGMFNIGALSLRES